MSGKRYSNQCFDFMDSYSSLNGCMVTCLLISQMPVNRAVLNAAKLLSSM